MKTKDFQNYVFSQLGGMYEWLCDLEEKIEEMAKK